MHEENKVMTARDAIARFLHDGDSLIVYHSGIPYSLILRLSVKRGLTYYSNQAPDAEFVAAIVKTVVHLSNKWGGRDAEEGTTKRQASWRSKTHHFTYNAR